MPLTIFHLYERVITNSGGDVDKGGFRWDNKIDLTSWLFLSVNKRIGICYREGNLYKLQTIYMNSIDTRVIDV